MFSRSSKYLLFAYFYNPNVSQHSYEKTEVKLCFVTKLLTFCCILFVFIIFWSKIVEIFKLFNICRSWSAPILFLNIRAKVAQGLPWVAYPGFPSHNQAADQSWISQNYWIYFTKCLRLTHLLKALQFYFSLKEVNEQPTLDLDSSWAGLYHWEKSVGK